MSTDARWVSDQYRKVITRFFLYEITFNEIYCLQVQHFIATSGLFDSNIVSENNIKPPSIKCFIYITSVLMKEIFPYTHINNENYKEVIPDRLRILKYPGKLTNSTLKTGK